MKKSTIKLLGLSMVALLLVTGCGKVPKLENGQDAVVTLKGTDISVDDLYNEIKERYALDSLLKLIDTKILNKEYKDTDEIKDAVQDEIDSMVQQYGGGDEQALLQQTTSAWGISTMKDLTKYMNLQNKRKKAVEDYAKSLVSDKEIEDYYEENIFGDISARHILISPDVTSDATDAEKEKAEKEALKEAKEIIRQLNDGAKFEDLAKEHSDDEASAKNGGLLSDFVHGEMAEEFEKAARELENGKYTTEPVKTQFGYHIILKVSQKDKPKLKTVKDDIIDELGSQKLSDDKTLQVTALVELRKKYNVKIQDSSLKDQYNKYISNMKEQLNSN